MPNFSSASNQVAYQTIHYLSCSPVLLYFHQAVGLPTVQKQTVLSGLSCARPRWCNGSIEPRVWLRNVLRLGFRVNVLVASSSSSRPQGSRLEDIQLGLYLKTVPYYQAAKRKRIGLKRWSGFDHLGRLKQIYRCIKQSLGLEVMLRTVGSYR